MPNWPKRNSVVEDGMGNHFIVIDVVGGVVNCESVATREIFTMPVSELSPTDRVVF